MLMKIDCSAATSVELHLLFDDNTTKDCVVSKGDLIEVEYNHNGLRKHAEGKVIKISCNGTDTKAWYIIVDNSCDFDSVLSRILVDNILDIDIIKKYYANNYIETPADKTGINGLRIFKGRLQYTIDGFNWYFVNTNNKNSVIKDEEGTIPEKPNRHSDELVDDEEDEDDLEDSIKDEEY
jgi:hypothetical protein